MQPDSNPELFVICTERLVLECRCGGSLILLGPEEDWYAEGRTTFECHECGGQLTLVDQITERRGPALIGDSETTGTSVRDLLSSLRTAEGQ